MRLTLLLCLILVSSSAFASIRTYFNGLESQNYVDPFRQISRPGDNLEAVIISELERAKKTIFVAVQEIRLPAVAKKLVERYRAGVDVRLVLEHSYNHNILAQHDEPEETGPDSHESTRYRDLVALIDIDRDGTITREEMLERDAIFILQQAKLPLIDDREDGSAGSGLMHHKFMVLDGRRVVISSANFTPSCIHGDVSAPLTRGNANALMVIESLPLAKIFTEEFNLFWAGKFGMNKPFRGARTVTVAGKRITVQFSPSSRSVAWDMTTNGLIARTLSGTKESIQAALFVFSEQKLADAMNFAHRKAQVKVMVEPKFAYRPYSEVLDLLGVTLPDSNCMVENGNAPWQPPISTAGQSSLPAGDVLHHKFAVIDHRKVIFGSHNWSDAANVINDEFLVVVDDAVVASQFDNEFARLSTQVRWGLPLKVQSDIDQMKQLCSLP